MSPISDYSGKVYAVLSKDRTRILTDVAWCNLQLLEYENESALFSRIPLDSEPFVFERSSDSKNCIQYYETQERAMEIIDKLHCRERDPIEEQMIIVSFNINIVVEDVLLYDPMSIRLTRILEAYEKEASRIYDTTTDHIQKSRKDDLSGYTNPTYQKSFKDWIDYTRRSLED